MRDHHFPGITFIPGALDAIWSLLGGERFVMAMSPRVLPLLIVAPLAVGLFVYMGKRALTATRRDIHTNFSIINTYP